MDKQCYAFISYSRKDLQIARTIQQKLEKYPYPADKVAEEFRPHDSKYIRRVFLDVTDLSARERVFTDELKKKLENTMYLIVICSRNSLDSDFVRQEIEYFYMAHGKNPELILPLLVDETISDFNPIIDEIINRRNCPIYFSTKAKTEHRLENKYCFYHIVEFLLKVDFNVLFNRYLAYTKSRSRKRVILVTVFFLVLTTFLGYGLHKKHRLAEFEKKTFPYSLVVGYVNNFMAPLLNCLNMDSCQPHFLLLMPKTYEDLDNKQRGKMYFNYIERNYVVDSLSKESYSSTIRKRNFDIMRLNLQQCDKPIYLDLVNTVSAFKYVIDYKVSSELYVEQSRDEMVEEYTKEFIQCALDSLAHYGELLHFVKDTMELREALNDLLR